MSEQRIRPTVIVPDTSPLVHLAAVDALTILNGLGRVVVDVVALEPTNDVAKPYAGEIAAWIEAGGAPGSNRLVELAATEFGPLYKLALDRGVKPPRNAERSLSRNGWVTSSAPSAAQPSSFMRTAACPPCSHARASLRL